MADEDWTPAKGYVIAACQLIVRSGIIVGLSVLAGIGFVKACDAMAIEVIHWALPFLTGLALGAIAGYVLAWHLADKCGLVGQSLMVPAVVLLGGAQFLAYHVTTAIHPGWDDVLGYLFVPAFVLGMLLAGKNFLLDS